MGKRQHNDLPPEVDGGKDEKDDRDLRTVFARGVAFSLSEADVEASFTDIGPVRKCFLVRTKGEEKHRGFGFIQFALPEDAERAVKELNGKEFGGRKLQLEIANKKAPLDQRYPKRPKPVLGEDGEPLAEQPAPVAAPEPAKPTRAKPAAKPPAAKKGPRERGAEDTQRRARTVAVGRLPEDKTALAAAMRMIKSIGPVEEVQDPAPKAECDKYKLPADGCTGPTVLVTYKNGKDAVAAVKKLHGQTVAAKDGAGASALWARVLSGEGSHVKKWRLIVRNLAFTVTEADLKAAFAPACFVWEAKVPLKPDGKMRGFGFVAFTTKADAEHGISLVNGTAIKGRPVAVDWAVSRTEFEDAKKVGEAAAAAAPKLEAAAATSDSENEDDDDEAEGSGSESEEEMGMDSEEEEEDDEEEEGDIGSEDGEEDEAAAAAAAAPAMAERQQELSLMQRVAGALIMGDAQAQAKEPEGKKKAEDKPKKEDKKGKEAGSADAHAKREEYEGRRSDPTDASSSGDKKGADKKGADGVLPSTVFIRNLPLDITQLTLKMRLETFGKVRSCRLVTDKVTGRCKGTAFADYVDHTSAVRASEASARAKKGQGPALTVGGSDITVDLALSKDGARSLAEEKAEGKKREKDRRNVYLAEEGRIVAGTPAWEQMSEGDRAKRERAYKEKKTKLASPNFIVSRTRLSVRNIPKSWSEERLKAACCEAVKRRALKAKPVVKQVKILKEEEGKDGAAKSKGLGFIEFDDHEHALCCLRELNNHPTAFGSRDRRPIVEFAMENVKIIKKREHLTNLAKERAQKEKKEGQGDAPKKVSRSKRRDERKKREREAAAAAAATTGEATATAAPEQQPPPAKRARPNPPAPGGKASKQTGRLLQDVSREAREKAAASKRQRVEREVAREDREVKRRRTEESELDRIVASAGLKPGAGPNEGLSRKGNKKGKKKTEETDRLDSLAEQYAKKLFGAGEDKPSANTRKAVAAAGGGIKRWFE